MAVHPKYVKSELRKHNKGYHRSPESLREELATGWGFLDGFLVGLTIGFAIAAAIVLSNHGL